MTQPRAAILNSRTLQSSPESGARAGYDGRFCFVAVLAYTGEQSEDTTTGGILARFRHRHDSIFALARLIPPGA